MTYDDDDHLNSASLRLGHHTQDHSVRHLLKNLPLFRQLYAPCQVRLHGVQREER
jgi:hypothetical protein